MSDDLNKYFEEYKSQKSDIQFDSLTSMMIRKKQMNQHKSTSWKTFTIISINKAKFASILALILLVSLGNYPVAKTKTVGYVVSFKADQQNVKEINKNLDKLPWLEKSAVTMYEKDSSGKKVYEFKVLLNDPSDSVLILKEKEIRSLASNMIVSVTPISGTMKIPAYTAALNSVFNYDYVAKVMNMHDFEKDINSQMQNAGISESFLELQEDEDGDNTYVIDIPQRTKIKLDSIKEITRIMITGIPEITVFHGNNYAFRYDTIMPPIPPQMYGIDKSNMKIKFNKYINNDANDEADFDVEDFDDFNGNVTIEFENNGIIINKKNNSIELKKDGKVFILKPGEIIIKDIDNKYSPKEKEEIETPQRQETPSPPAPPGKPIIKNL